MTLAAVRSISRSSRSTTEFSKCCRHRAIRSSAVRTLTSGSSNGWSRYSRPIAASIFARDRLALQRLKEAAERAKCELSSVGETNISLPFIAADASGPKHINANLTRDKFEELVQDLVDASVEPCQKALWDAKLQPNDIDKVILVGGQTRSPIIARTVTEVFGKEPSAEINPDEVVAMGAAIQGGVLTGDVKDIVLLDVLPLSLGLETRGGLFVKLIPRNSSIPLRNTMTFTTVVDNQQIGRDPHFAGRTRDSTRKPQP